MSANKAASPSDGEAVADEVPMTTLVVSHLGKRMSIMVPSTTTWERVAVHIANISSPSQALTPTGGHNLRLLHRGRIVDCPSTLADGGVRSGDAVLALKVHRSSSSGPRALSHQPVEAKSSSSFDAAFDAAQDAVRDAAAISRAASPRGRETSRSAGSAAKNAWLGDDLDESVGGDFFVRVLRGGNTYRIKVDEEEGTVGTLKERLTSYVNIAPTEQVLVHGGRRNFADSELLVRDLGVKRGTKLILLLSRKEHDVAEARVEIEILEKEVCALAYRVSAVEKEVHGRLLSDYSEVSVAIGALEGELDRLMGNVEAVQGFRQDSEEFRQSNALRQKLLDMESAVSALRERAKITLAR